MRELRVRGFAGLLALSLALAGGLGCIDWQGFERRPKPTPNPKGVAAIEQAIRAGMPEWDVSLGDDGIHAVLQLPEGTPETAPPPQLLFTGDPAQIEHHVAGGAASLVDYLAIARAIAAHGYRLPRWTAATGGTSPTPSARTRADEDLGSPSEGAEAAAPLAGRPANLATAVHDRLVAYVALRTAPAARHATCEGSNAACGHGRRAFASGIPCAVGAESSVPAAWTKAYGFSWCAAAFCPAMEKLAREEEDR